MPEETVTKAMLERACYLLMDFITQRTQEARTRLYTEESDLLHKPCFPANKERWSKNASGLFSAPPH